MRFAHQDRSEEELDRYIHNHIMKLATACGCLRTFLLLNNVAYETHDDTADTLAHWQECVLELAVPDAQPGRVLHGKSSTGQFLQTH